MKTAFFLRLSLLSCVALLAHTAFALMTEPMSPEQLLANADMIFVGTVTNVSSHWTVPTEAMISTDYTIELNSILYDPHQLFGAKTEGETVTLSFAGGTVGQKKVWVPDMPAFTLNEQAVFMVDGKNLHAISPLVGVDQGAFRLLTQNGRQVIANISGGVVKRRFFSQTDDAPAGLSLNQFLSDVQTKLPTAKSRPELKQQVSVAIPNNLRGLIFTGDQIPIAHPASGTPVLGPSDLPAEEQLTLPEPQSPFERTFTTAGSDVLQRHESTPLDYGFLWVPPNAPSVYNIPPLLYTGAQWGLNFEYCLSDWNRYATNVFRKYVTSDNNFSHQGRNDFAFTDTTNFQTVYGFALGASTLGIAVMYNSNGNNIQPNQQIFESDVILNANKNWTLDWNTAYHTLGTWYFRSTVIHEVGHTFGREHQFTSQPNSVSNSVMNYPPAPKLDVEFWKPFVDDAGSIRAAYPARVAAISDMGVHLFRTTGMLNGRGYNDVQFSTFPAAVQAGQSFNLNNFIIENLGTTQMTPQIDWYLTPQQQTFTGAYYCNTTNHPQMNIFSQLLSTRAINVPANVPAGNYYVAAFLTTSDAHNWNRSAWSDTTIQVTVPGNGMANVIFYSHPDAGSPILRENCNGAPLADGTTVKIFWDANSNGPDDLDPQVPVCANNPGCANYNQFSMNGQDYYVQGGTFYTVNNFILNRPDTPFYYLRVYCENGGVAYVSEVVTLQAGGPFQIPLVNWTCLHCEACQGDSSVVLTPNNQDFPADQSVSACVHLCRLQPTRICVPVISPADVPNINVTPGCHDSLSCFDPTCEPAENVIFDGQWTYELVDSQAYYCTTIQLGDGATEGCVCVSLDFVLAVEMGTISAIPRDNAVDLTWTTRSESNLRDFEISRSEQGSEPTVLHRENAANSSSGNTYRFTDATARNGHRYTYSVVAIGLDGGRSTALSINVDVPSASAPVITDYALHQNYPNPFNPTTEITYDMKDAGFVSLKVYNLLGQQVAVLLNGSADQGRHVITFNAANLPSGVYLYRMETSGFTDQQKMLLMK